MTRKKLTDDQKLDFLNRLSDQDFDRFVCRLFRAIALYYSEPKFGGVRWNPISYRDPDARNIEFRSCDRFSVPSFGRSVLLVPSFSSSSGSCRIERTARPFFGCSYMVQVSRENSVHPEQIRDVVGRALGLFR